MEVWLLLRGNAEMDKTALEEGASTRRLYDISPVEAVYAFGANGA